ncbi:MAG: LysR family transcriptional regulator [Wenzhouxiangellaceae bacterium]
METIDRMRVFVAVAREGSFTRGAEQLNLSVQMASKAVRQLEERLKAQLFDRTTRSVTLNETGQAYFERCLDLLDQFDEVESVVRAEHGTLSGRIRITAPTSFAERYVVPELAEFLRRHPGIRIELSITDRKISLVDEGYDLAIRISQLSDSSMVARKLAPMRVIVVASPAYLSKHGTPAEPAELSQHTCIIDSNFKHERRWPFMINGAIERIAVDGPFQANTPEATRQMALAGIGIAHCAKFVITEDLAQGRLVPLFEQLEGYNAGVYALYPHRRHLSARVRALVDHLHNGFRRQSM